MPTVTAIIDSTHFGGSTALAPPEFVNDDGQTIKASRAQGKLWEWWGEFWEYSRGLCKKHKARLVIVHLGDVVDGVHHGNVQLLPNVEDQEQMAFEVLEPLALRADKFYIIRGTETHGGPVNSSEVRIADRLGAVIYWEALLLIDGTHIDVLHHGRAGGREWTSVATGVALEAQLRALREGNPIPRYAFRGHAHTIDDSGENVPGTRALMLPSWQLKTAYGHKRAAGKRNDIGGVFMLPDGSLDLSRLRYHAAPGEGRPVIHV